MRERDWVWLKRLRSRDGSVVLKVYQMLRDAKVFGRWMRGALGVSSRTPPGAESLTRSRRLSTSPPQRDKIHIYMFARCDELYIHTSCGQNNQNNVNNSYCESQHCAYLEGGHGSWLPFLTRRAARPCIRYGSPVNPAVYFKLNVIRLKHHVINNVQSCFMHSASSALGISLHSLISHPSMQKTSRLRLT
jgi:hypothetical protein